MEHVLDIKNLCLNLNGKDILNEANFSVKKGEMVFVAGKNGSGKSCLFNCISNRISSYTGEIEVNDSLCYHEQKPVFITDMTIIENLKSFNILLKSMFSDNDLLELVSCLGLSEVQNSNTSRLSGGEKQRIALGITLLRNKGIYIFDEAESAMDPIGRKFYFNTLKHLKEKGKTVIWISHHIKESLAVAERGYFLSGGKAYEFDVNEIRELVTDDNEDSFARICEERVVK